MKKSHKITPSTDHLRPGDRFILSHLDAVGVSSPMVLRVKFGYGYSSMQEILHRLYITGNIIRPHRGLVLSVKYYQTNQNERKTLEATLKTVLPL